VSHCSDRGDQPAAAEDAAEHVAVEYEELEAVTDMSTALTVDAGDPRFTGDISPLSASHRGAVDLAFADLTRWLRRSSFLDATRCVTLEPRAVVADWNAAEARLTIYQGTQAPHMVRISRRCTWA